MSLTRCRRAISAMIVAVVLDSVVFGADPNATITGLVTDPAGRVVTGVSVVLTNVNTNVARQTVTNAQGIYRVVGLAPGVYRANITKDGFKSIAKGDIELHVQDEVSLNFSLQVGSVAETITVEGGAPLINSESGTMSTIVDHQFVKEIPLNGRSFQTLFQVTPGAVIASTSYPSQGQFSVNGQRTSSNYFQVDGVSANVGVAAGANPGQSIGGSLPALTASGGTNGLVSVDALQEFAILTSDYAPEYGRSPGAQVVISTRSGTNQFHGDAFEYFRNDVLDANDWFANNQSLPRAALRLNDFGGVVGGPIRKNKTFFFLSYEGMRLLQPTTGLSDVPSVETRQSSLSSVRAFLNAFPLPTGADEGDGLAPGNYTFSNPSNLDAGSIRLDHHFSQNLAVFARYNYSSSEVAERGGGQNSLSTVLRIPLVLKTLTLGSTWSPRVDLNNDLRINLSWSSASTTFVNDNLGGAVPLSLSTIAPAGQSVSSSLFGLSIDSGNNSALALGQNARNLQRQFNVVDTASLQVGTHLLKIGFDFRRLTPQESLASYEQNVFFGSAADAAAGMPTDGAEVLAFANPVNAIYDNYSVFAQDAWKAANRLTLTYGLRWEHDPVPTGHGPGGLQPLIIVNGGDLKNLFVAPPGTPLFHAPRDNFAPRIGFAYRILDSGRYAGVLRGGTGVFYDMAVGPTGNVFNNAPFLAGVVSFPASFPLSPSDAAPPALGEPPFFVITAFPKDLRQPYTYHWNLAYDQLFGQNQSFTVAYVGSAGHSLLRRDTVQGGPLPPDVQQAAFINNFGYSNYNALQASFRKRAGNGLDIIASYTYSHSLDNSSSDTAQNPPSIEFNPAQDYGNSDFDIRHSVSLALDYQPTVSPASRLLSAMFGGWGLNTLLLARSAPPVNVTILQNAGFGFQTFRPNLNPGVPVYLHDDLAPGRTKFNPSAFSLAPAGGQGNLERNDLRGFTLFQQDISVRRSFPLTEKLKLQARVEAFNVFNHPNFAPEKGALGFARGGVLLPTGGFGVSQSMFGAGVSSDGTASGFSPLFQVGGPRSLQLALKVEF